MGEIIDFKTGESIGTVAEEDDLICFSKQHLDGMMAMMDQIPDGDKYSIVAADDNGVYPIMTAQIVPELKWIVLKVGDPMIVGDVEDDDTD